MSTNFKCHMCRSTLSVKKSGDNNTYYVKATPIYINAECPVCYETQESLFTFPCGHPICNECLKKQNLKIEPYLNSGLDNKNISNNENISNLKFIFHHWLELLSRPSSVFHTGEMFSSIPEIYTSTDNFNLRCTRIMESNIIRIGKKIGTDIKIMETHSNRHTASGLTLRCYNVYEVYIYKLVNELKNEAPSSIITNKVYLEAIIDTINNNPRIFHYTGKNFFFLLK